MMLLIHGCVKVKNQDFDLLYTLITPNQNARGHSFKLITFPHSSTDTDCTHRANLYQKTVKS